MKPKYKLRSLVQDSLHLNSLLGIGLPQQFVYTLRDFLIDNEGAPGVTVTHLAAPTSVEYHMPTCLNKAAEPNVFTHLMDCIRYTEFPAWRLVTLDSPQLYSDLVLFTTPDHQKLILDNSKLPGKAIPEVGSKALKPYPLKKVAGSAFLAFDRWASQYYYHWIIDALPRFLALQDIDFDGVVLLPNGVADFMKETLALIGIDPDNYTFLEMEKRCRYQFDSLIYAQKRSVRNSTHPDAVIALQAAFSSSEPGDLKDAIPRRIYIPRNKAKTRNVANEEVLINRLKNELDFQAVYCEDLSMAEKHAMFAAETVIATHSSGLTNLIFCKPGTKVVEIVPENFVTEAFLAISMHLKLEHYYDIAPVKNGELIVDIDRFIEHITPILANGS